MIRPDTPPAHRDAAGRFTKGASPGPGRRPGRKPPRRHEVDAGTLRLQVLRDLSHGPDAYALAQLELALHRSAAGRTETEIEKLLSDTVDTAIQIARAARTLLIRELQRQHGFAA